MDKINKALGLFYFGEKNIDEAALETGIDKGTLVERIKEISQRSIKALKEFYDQGGVLGYIASKYNISRIDILGFMHRYKLNRNYNDRKSKTTLIALEEAFANPSSRKYF